MIFLVLLGLILDFEAKASCGHTRVEGVILHRQPPKNKKPCVHSDYTRSVSATSLIPLQWKCSGQEWRFHIGDRARWTLVIFFVKGLAISLA